MKQVLLTLSFVFGIVFLASSQTTTKSTKAADNTALLLGKWKGTYNGGTPGTCEMEFTRDGKGTLTGKLAFQPDGGEKSSPTTFNSVSLEGNNLKATFIDPDGEEIKVDGKLESKQMKGNWRTADNEGGTWQTTKTQ